MVCFTVFVYILLVCQINPGEHPWLTVVFLVVMWIAGYQIRPYIHILLDEEFSASQDMACASQEMILVHPLGVGCRIQGLISTSIAVNGLNRESKPKE